MEKGGNDGPTCTLRVLRDAVIAILRILRPRIVWGMAMTNHHSSPVNAEAANWNADDWHLFLTQYVDNRATAPYGMSKVALKIADTMDRLRIRAQCALTSPTLGSSIDLLIGLSFKRVETLNPDAKRRYYVECGCCGGTDENRDHYRTDIAKVAHKEDCPLARDLPILRSIGLSSDAAFTSPESQS